MSRIKSFSAPHKGLRNVLSRFSLTLGHTDFSDRTELTNLKHLGQEMFTLLKNHAETENTHTLRHLEERAKGASKHDMEDHERLEEIQSGLEKRLDSFSGEESGEEIHSYYLDFSLFHSLYLEHIHEEEKVTELLLQQHFTDDELVQHRITIMKKLAFPMLCLWLKYIIPAQPQSEGLGMLSALRQSASPEVFDLVMNTIKTEMPVDRFESLSAALA